MKDKLIRAKGTMLKIGEPKQFKNNSIYLELKIKIDGEVRDFYAIDFENTPRRFRVIENYFGDHNPVEKGETLDISYYEKENGKLKLDSISNRIIYGANWKTKIVRQIDEATKLYRIDSPLKKLCRLLLKGDTEFQMIYSSTREKYIRIRFLKPISKNTAKILLINGYKGLFFNEKRDR